MKRTRSKILVPLVGLAVTVVIVMVIYNKVQRRADEGIKRGRHSAAPVEVARIEHGPIELRRTYSGILARTAATQAVEAITNLKHIVRLDVRLAINEVERARKQIAASKATRVFEEETLAAENKRFDVGASTALLVAQAQCDLLASRIAEVQAVINYRVALVRLYVTEGSLLERRGIRMPAGNELQGPY